MKTSFGERMKRVLFGLSLVGGGMFVFFMPLNVAALMIGMMLVGLGIDPRGTEFPEDELPAKAPEKESEKPAPAAAKPSPSQKKKARKK
jgi:hypothetical protein